MRSTGTPSCSAATEASWSRSFSAASFAAFPAMNAGARKRMTCQNG